MSGFRTANGLDLGLLRAIQLSTFDQKMIRMLGENGGRNAIWPANINPVSRQALSVSVDKGLMTATSLEAGIGVEVGDKVDVLKSGVRTLLQLTDLGRKALEQDMVAMKGAGLQPVVG